ncbi:LytR/AlgR family response regulator transcription factor [Clostridium ljungdahlii]|uniref:Stage 0 sporulation protein A homolog n=1 Tax=Clostridium ljungdahlii TaxID=1538 RepID=A0A162L901_9CLOT|nr:LytTR family DNA-binding domain-containing protein [Clostridium ljungdahlii]OAA90336.1 Transcriptional regulatory protein YehT [Clostridium ljungdahlii]
MLNIAICDDEKSTRDYIKSLILSQKISCDVKEYISGKDLFKSKIRHDIIFLDIEMNNLDGITTAKKIRNSENELCRSILIFVTGFDRYVYDAFDVHAFHYLLKPIDSRKFIEVLKNAVLEYKKSNEKSNKYILIKIGTTYKKVFLKEIYYVESNRRKVILYTQNGTQEYYAKMDDVESQLGSAFFRCHRGYIVNMAYITEYDTSSITLENGIKLIISKHKYNDFVKNYLRYLKTEVIYL